MPRTRSLERARGTWRDVPGWEGFYRVARDGRVMRVAPGHHAKPGHLMSPNNQSVVLSAPGRPGRSVRRATLVREAFGADELILIASGGQPRIAFREMRPNKCWCWDTLVEMMATGPAHSGDVAERVYGSRSLGNRRAASQLLRDLANPAKYVGGPYVVRIRKGWYGLANQALSRPTTEQRLVDRLTYKPQSYDEIQEYLGVSRSTVDSLFRRLRKTDRLHSEVARSPDRAAWFRVYWLGKRARERKTG